MADQRVSGALEFIQEQIAAKLVEVATQKKLANSLAAAAGLEPPYADIEEPGAVGQASAIRSDQFANHSAPSTAARAFLEMRGKTRGATTIDVIYEALVQGGYNFGASMSDAKNGLRIALGKDSQVHRLPNGNYGLLQWYPNMGRPRGEKGKKPGEPETESDDAQEAPASEKPS